MPSHRFTINCPSTPPRSNSSRLDASPSGRPPATSGESSSSSVRPVQRVGGVVVWRAAAVAAEDTQYTLVVQHTTQRAYDDAAPCAALRRSPWKRCARPRRSTTAAAAAAISAVRTSDAGGLTSAPRTFHPLSARTMLFFFIFFSSFTSSFRPSSYPQHVPTWSDDCCTSLTRHSPRRT